jgi:tRNA uridine 5-carboxymethylaminomethyl modification enzyme
LPESVQYDSLRKVPGFENVRMFRPGYAVEYDFFPPTQLTQSLETNLVTNLFFAGQINGTTGYEEAACQGLIAGINAYRKINDEGEFTLKRSEAYIGVLIDDLTTKGTEEPYRMFTSRAEYRTLLRQDNADLRLTEKGYAIGLASQERYDTLITKRNNIKQLTEAIRQAKVQPDEINGWLSEKGSSPLREKSSFYTLIKRPEIGFEEVKSLLKNVVEIPVIDDEVIEQSVIEIKYEDYLNREKQNADKLDKWENLSINPTFNYDLLKALSFEGKEKLKKSRPTTIGQASRISGVSPSDVSILLVYMGR